MDLTPANWGNETERQWKLLTANRQQDFVAAVQAHAKKNYGFLQDNHDRYIAVYEAVTGISFGATKDAKSLLSRILRELPNDPSKSTLKSPEDRINRHLRPVLFWLCHYHYRDFAKQCWEDFGLTYVPTPDHPDLPRPNPDSTIQNPPLGPRPAERGLLHYASKDRLRIVGRDTEQRDLRDFINASEPFLWMQIAGVAGQGKSRLALELWNELAPVDQSEQHQAFEGQVWTCGFFEQDRIEPFRDKWRSWLPDRNYLLIADYVVGQEDEVGHFISALAGRRKVFGDLKIRLLLVERQRWDRGVLTDLRPRGSDADAFTFNQAEKTAIWYDRIRSRCQEAEILDECRFRPVDMDEGIIELEYLDPEHLKNLTKSTIKANGGSVYQADHQIEAQLRKIDPQGRPLYAYLLGKILAVRPDEVVSSSEKLLSDVIENEWAKRWKPELGEETPILGDERPATTLAIIATILDGLDVGAELRRGTISDEYHPDKVKNSALVLTDGPRSGGSRGAGHLIPPLQPDLLGEWLIIASMKNGFRSMAEVMSLCWTIGSRRTSLFLKRLVQDFPTSDLTLELLTLSLNGSAAWDAMSEQVVLITETLDGEGIDPPASIMKLLDYAANSQELPMALNELASRHLRGKDVPIDHPEAVRLLKLSAAQRNPLGMFHLGVMYHVGQGVSLDAKKANYWFEKSAHAGHKIAMNNFGLYLLKGAAGEPDSVAAGYWFERSFEAGYIVALRNLVGMYSRGDVGAPGEVKIIDWHEQAAEAGDAECMYNLAVIYSQPKEFPPDIAKSMHWLSRAACAEFPPAMYNLGVDFYNGVGAEPDLVQALFWFEKAAESYHPRAMYNLATMYSNGDGVRRDLEKALFWFEKAAEAGLPEAQEAVREFAESN